ncbi:MAG: hypothetical protein ACI8PZ_006368 [Myxococcota bacterium]|jgi:hypothetical protein
MRATLALLALAVSSTAAAQSLAISGSCPGPMTFDVTGLTPGAEIVLVAGSGPGAARIPAGPCADLSSGLAGPLRKVAGPLRDADRDGRVTLSPTVPGGACGSSLVALELGTCGLTPPVPLAGGDEFVLFVTNTFIGSDPATWLLSRGDADAYCASYAASNGIAGSDFRIVYSTPSEDAWDYLAYSPGPDARVYDRDGVLVDSGDLWDGSDIALPDMVAWTITGSWSDGAFHECDGAYPSGSWPICQYCDEKFACGTTGDNPFEPSSCCWTGIRAVVCMGTL